jgi:hypothetical protein
MNTFEGANQASPTKTLVIHCLAGGRRVALCGDGPTLGDLMVTGTVALRRHLRRVCSPGDFGPIPRINGCILSVVGTYSLQFGQAYRLFLEDYVCSRGAVAALSGAKWFKNVTGLIEGGRPSSHAETAGDIDSQQIWMKPE